MASGACSSSAAASSSGAGCSSSARASRQPKPSGSSIAKAICEEILTDEFFQKHWEKYPKHYRAAERCKSANQFPKALDTDDIMHIVRCAGSSLKMFKRGKPYDTDNYYVGYLDGVSLIVNQADRANATLLEFCQEMAKRLFNHVFGVMYLTPPESQAVGLHNDDQDVLLMQVWGTKRWKIRNAPQLLPYTEEMLGKDTPVPANLIEDPIMTFTMEPHDVLYIPRGYLHEAETSDQSSLHMTITIPTSDYCWGAQLVKHLMQTVPSGEIPRSPVSQQLAVRSSAQFRGKSGADEDAAQDKEIERLVEAWVDSVKVEDVLGSFEDRMARMNDTQERTLAQKKEIRMHSAIFEAGRVRLMYGVRCKCDPDSEMAFFSRVSDGQRLELGIKRSASPLIRALTSKPQKVADLPCEDTFERLCVLQLLLHHGVLQLIKPSSTEPDIAE